MINNAEYIIKSLLNLRPGAGWHLAGDSYSSIQWMDTRQAKPTEAEIQAEVDRLQAAHQHNQYQRQRAAEYPSIQQQLDMQYWDEVNGTTTWQDAIAEIKNKYPKPTGDNE